MTKYYHAENAGRVIAGQRFEVYAISSSIAFGIFKTDDKDIQASLDAAVKDVRSAVTSITEAEFLACDKKKPTSLSSFHQSHTMVTNAQSEMASQAMPMKGAGAVVSIEPVIQAEPEVVVDGQVEKTEDALKVTKVSIPTDAHELDKPAKKK